MSDFAELCESSFTAYPVDYMIDDEVVIEEIMSSWFASDTMSLSGGTAGVGSSALPDMLGLLSSPTLNHYEDSSGLPVIEELQEPSYTELLVATEGLEIVVQPEKSFAY
jgi:hypothetical protein